MSGIIKNYAIRLVRRTKNGKFDYEEDNVVNQIAFAEGYGYTTGIDEIVYAVKDIALPADIIVEMKHNWSGTLPKGSPLSVYDALKKEGYERVSNLSIKGWHISEEDDRVKSGKIVTSRRFLVMNVDDVNSLKNILWAESKERSVDWKGSEERSKVIEAGQPYGVGHPFNKEWWM